MLLEVITERGGGGGGGGNPKLNTKQILKPSLDEKPKTHRKNCPLKQNHWVSRRNVQPILSLVIRLLVDRSFIRY